MKDTENKNEDVQARIKAFAEASGYHTYVPIFEDIYSTTVAYNLVKVISSPPYTEKEKRKKARQDNSDAVKIK